MKPATVFGLCVISVLVGGVAGVYGGIFLDRRAGDAYGANMHANEMATHLKVMSAVLFLLNKDDTPGAQKLLRQAIGTSKTVIESAVRTIPSLTPPTLARMDEAMSVAEKAESAPVSPTADPRRD